MKIRTIKPEFWTSSKVSSVPRDARLLFIGLLNDADDFGRLHGSTKRLAGVLFPGDEDVDGPMVGVWLGQLESARLIQRYAVGGAAFIAICGFAEHQKIDRRVASRIPPPPDEVQVGNTGKTAEPAEKTAEPAGVPVAPPEKGALDLDQGSGIRDLERGGGNERPSPHPAAPRPKPPRRYANRLPHEMEVWRETAEDLLTVPMALIGPILRLPAPHAGSLADHCRRLYPAFDDTRGRPSALKLIKASWPSFEQKFFAHGAESALSGLLTWIGRDYAKALYAWERDGNVDASAMLKSAPTGPRLRPADDDDLDDAEGAEQ